MQGGRVVLGEAEVAMDGGVKLLVRLAGVVHGMLGTGAWELDLWKVRQGV